MRIFIIALLVLLIGCGEKDAPAASRPAIPKPIPGKPAGDILKAHPDYLVSLSRIWVFRISSYLNLNGIEDEYSCPALRVIEATDEFERHNATAVAIPKCKAENARALSLIKLCPVSIRLHVHIEEYNFQTKSFPIYVRAGAKMRFGDDGAKIRVEIEKEEFLNKNPEAILMWDAATYDGSLVVIHLSMPEPKAKQFREILKTDGDAYFRWLELAALLDETGKHENHSLLIGHVLAWRLEHLTDWITESKWEPLASCSEAVKFFQ